MRVSEIMSRDVETISPKENGFAAFRRMAQNKIRHLVVVEGGRMVGILSSRDIPGEHDWLLADQTVEELMTTTVATTSLQTTLKQAANLLRGQRIGCLPVLEADRVVGIVTTSDLLETVGKGSQEQGASGNSRWKPVRRSARWPHVASRKKQG
jgi:acetoin utilization protein AcuB